MNSAKEFRHCALAIVMLPAANFLGPILLHIELWTGTKQTIVSAKNQEEKSKGFYPEKGLNIPTC